MKEILGKISFELVNKFGKILQFSSGDIKLKINYSLSTNKISEFTFSNFFINRGLINFKPCFEEFEIDKIKSKFLKTMPKLEFKDVKILEKSESKFDSEASAIDALLKNLNIDILLLYDNQLFRILYLFEYFINNSKKHCYVCGRQIELREYHWICSNETCIIYNLDNLSDLLNPDLIDDRLMSYLFHIASNAVPLCKSVKDIEIYFGRCPNKYRINYGSLNKDILAKTKFVKWWFWCIIATNNLRYVDDETLEKLKSINDTVIIGAIQIGDVDEDFDKSCRVFHGSSIQNWIGLINSGPQNLSNTNYMTTGAVHGSGIYTALDFNTSFNYSIKGNIGDTEFCYVGYCKINNKDDI